jgi:CubicO group peptidase (beta-lactamase class C family)
MQKRISSLWMSSVLLGLAVGLGAAAPQALAQSRSTKRSAPLKEAAPQKAGVSPERLERLDAMAREAIQEDQVPGMVMLMARDGKIVYYKAFGMADNESRRPLKRDDIFRIASQSKAITATGVMILWEEGRFKLDDPISKYIPEFKNPQVLRSYNEADGTWTGEPAKTEITIRHLLTHTSGIGYGVIDGDDRFKKIYAKAGVTDLFTTEPVTITESVKKLARLPLHHHPGEKFTYSEGLDVLGYFIEVISGMPFDTFLQKRLFDPLGMRDTGFYLPSEKASRLVPVQIWEEGKWVRLPVTFYDPDYPIKGAKSFFSGGAGLCSSAKDYATFLQVYLNQGELGGVRILSRTTVQTILSRQVGGDEKYSGLVNLAFGLVPGDAKAKGGEGTPGTFNWGGYFNTQYFADPVEKVVGILMKQTQRTTKDETAWKFRLLVGQAIDD